MAPTMARVPGLEASSFDILEDAEPQPSVSNVSSVSFVTKDALDELPVDHCLNRAGGRGPNQELLAAKLDGDKPEAKSLKAVAQDRRDAKASPAPRRRRPVIEAETFEPLSIVEEEISSLSEIHAPVGSECPETVLSQLPLPTSSDKSAEQHHPLFNADTDSPLRNQIEKHLAGQFEWLISSPPTVGPAEGHASSDMNAIRVVKEPMVYGCTLLSRNRLLTESKMIDDGHPSANKYTFLATPIRNAFLLHTLQETSPTETMSWPQLATPQGTPLTVPNVFEITHQAVSPSLTVVSERSGSFRDGSSRAGSFSIPRIEDSLEELDRLEEELEAVDAVYRGRNLASLAANKPPQPTPHVSDAQASTIRKRASMAGLSSTMRIQTTGKANPALRRSASFTVQNKQQRGAQATTEQKFTRTSIRSKPSMDRLAGAKSPAKSTKPPTVAKFELPGEAVGRRLKEQREARQAQQAEALRASAPPIKPRHTKPLEKPTFELPGEAISRRKREGLDAKLRAQEEEDRKRREFKARPIRLSIGQNMPPRETITSRARQSIAFQDETMGTQAEVNKVKRMSMTSARASPSPYATQNLQKIRNRHSIIFPVDNSGRATPASNASAGEKRSTLSAEEAAQLKLQSRTSLRDSYSFMPDKERERREREVAAKKARDEAAERSRMASREWAEKKRRRELAMKQAMQEAARNNVQQVRAR